jgi:protein-disulfide isomerase
LKLVVLSTAFLVSVCAIVIFAFQNTLSTANTKEIQNKPKVVDKEATESSIKGQPTLGTNEASIHIVEFGDFLCPACQTWNEVIFPMLEQDYIETGKAKFSFVNVLYHGDSSKLASLSAETVQNRDPESYWKFHDQLYREIKKERKIDKEGIEKIVKKSTNVSTVDLNSDLEDLRLQDELDLDGKLVEKHDVSSTPSLMINGTLLENPFDYEEIEKVIKEFEKADESNKEQDSI